MPDLSTYSDSRLMDYAAFCDRMAHDYANSTAKGRTHYRREFARVSRFMDANGPRGL